MRSFTSLLLVALLACNSADLPTAPVTPPPPPVKPDTVIVDTVSSPRPPAQHPPVVGSNTAPRLSNAPQFNGSNRLGDSLEYDVAVPIDTSAWQGSVYLMITACDSLDDPVPCNHPAADTLHGHPNQPQLIVNANQLNRFNWIFSGHTLHPHLPNSTTPDTTISYQRMDYHFEVRDGTGTVIQAYNGNLILTVQ